MAKKEKRSKGAGGGARNQNAIKHTAAARKEKPPNTKNNWLRWNTPIVVATCAAILAVLLLVSRTNNDGNDGNDGDPSGGHPVPRIDGIATKFDPERGVGEKTRGFLDNFVCNHEPDTDISDAIPKAVIMKGYCHPRLSADPLHRTQRVTPSITADSTSWWRIILPMINGSELHNDQGIPKGELVMRLPRPLQIWDLDGLRDGFIQQEFLGLGPNGNNEKDTNEPRATARHTHTHNPLDSGAFLAVYLIRLLHGSQSKKFSRDVDNDGQCPNESGECNAQLKWDDVEQHRHRINMISAYLNVLPTVLDRQQPSNTNPHSHPSFWPASLLQSLFPRNTHTYDLIRNNQQMIESEYKALTSMSVEFGNHVNYSEYLNMRINVLSRAFGVPASTNDIGLLWDTSGYTRGLPIIDEMKMYETSNFGKYLDNAQNVDAEDRKGLKLHSMCPLLDMYNSHPNGNVSWRYNSKTSSYDIHASRKSNIPPGNSIVVSYGKYTDGHLFAKYGYINGDGSSPTEISLAVFHRMIGDVGLGRQFSQLPFDMWYQKEHNDRSHGEIDVAKKALEVQAKELLRYLLFDDGYKDCIDVTLNTSSADEELKLLKLRHLIRIANYREAWVVRIPPKSPDASPLQSMGSTRQKTEQEEGPVGVNANRIVSICRLLSLRVDDIRGEAINYLREGLTSAGSLESPGKIFFLAEKCEDELEYRAMMCVVRLCNVALGRYSRFDQTEPEIVGSIEWNAWYIVKGEVRALGIIQQTAASEANKVKHNQMISATNAAMTVREEGACPLNYSLPLLSRL